MTWTTNHNKTAGRGWSASQWVSQSQHHTTLSAILSGRYWWLHFWWVS